MARQGKGRLERGERSFALLLEGLGDAEGAPEEMEEAEAGEAGVDVAGVLEPHQQLAASVVDLLVRAVWHSNRRPPPPTPGG